MIELSLTERLLRYFEKHANEKISGGEIERLVMHHTTYKASTVSRRLREMVEDGILQPSYEKGYVVYQLKTRQLSLV